MLILLFSYWSAVCSYDITKTGRNCWYKSIKSALFNIAKLTKIWTTPAFLKVNRANLRDLIVAIGLVTQMHSNRRLIGPCDLDICWMTSKNSSAPFLLYLKLCASFQSHRKIQTGFIIQKPSFRVKTGDFPMWPWRMTLKKQQGTSSILHAALCIVSSHRWNQTGVVL